MSAERATPRTDLMIVSQSFVDETRMFDRHYYVLLLEHARQLERELFAAKSEVALESENMRHDIERLMSTCTTETNLARAYARDCETLARWIRRDAPKAVRELAQGWAGDQTREDE